jgi:peptidoglycan/xylan/chitin deacetylase (PgdA/CDA1 family)
MHSGNSDLRRPIVVRALIALLVALGVAWLSAAPTDAQVWDEISGGDPNSGMVALTFDAGSVDGPALTILDTLRAYNLKVTFFLTGQWVESYPAVARRVAEDGHELANHTYYHPDLVNLSTDKIAWELDYTNGVIQRDLGRTSKPWFRPPFGSRNQRVLDIARGLGYRSIYWTLDSGDWRNNATAAGVLYKVLHNAGGGDIVVHHVAADQTAESLPAEIEGLQAQGLRIVTVSELLGMAPTR